MNTIKLIDGTQPTNLDAYGDYLCMNDNEEFITLKWGLRGWYEPYVGCYEGNIIAYAFLNNTES